MCARSRFTIEELLSGSLRRATSHRGTGVAQPGDASPSRVNPTQAGRSADDSSGFERPVRVMLLDVERHCTFGSSADAFQPVEVGARDGQEVGQELVAQQEGHQAEVEQLGVRRPVVVLLELDPGILQVDDL